MELFNKEGHLTDEGLRAVVDGTLDEMGRLEASEHLSFCDSCLVRYTELLADDPLRHSRWCCGVLAYSTALCRTAPSASRSRPGSRRPSAPQRA